MTTAEAIQKTAAQYKMNGYYRSNPQRLHRDRILHALFLLGFSWADAGALSASATQNAYPKDWRQCVRDEVKADKLAESQNV